MAKQILMKLDCSLVVVTLGALGLVVAFSQERIGDVVVLELEAIAGIHPVDSTGAGDCFIGYFVGSLMKYGVLPQIWKKEAVNEILVPCLKVGIAASGLSTLKKGTILSYPDKISVLEKINSI